MSTRPDTDSWQLPYPSRRQPALGGDVIATSHPLATEAGMRAYRDGGNAVDAALAAAITLTVVEPVSNGIGSDAFALVWDGHAVHGLNASGRSPALLDAGRLGAAAAMPLLGWDSVTVPGAVSGWVALSERFGALPFAATCSCCCGSWRTARGRRRPPTRRAGGSTAAGASPSSRASPSPRARPWRRGATRSAWRSRYPASAVRSWCGP